MRPALLEATLTARCRAHFSGTRLRPAYVIGKPGVGKTQMITSIARSMGVGLATLHAPLMLSEDFGMPNLSEREVTFATPGHKFPFVDSEHFPEEFGIIDVEEVAQCTPDQQKIWANLFQEGELHGRRLKPGWTIMATGNRMQDRAGAARILSHFNDRFTTYEFDHNVDDWCTWALDHGVRPEVVSFIHWRPDLLMTFDPNAEKSATPRAWTEGVSPVIDVIAPEALFETLKGDVGDGPAAEFAGFLETYRSLPNPDLIIANPQSGPIPTELNVIYALCGALAHRANADNFGAILDYARRLPPEYMLVIVRDVTRRDKELANHKDYVAWAIKEGAQLLAY